MAGGAHDGRFAPSPTGPLHLGNLRTALAAWLFARSRGGRFAIRMEDLDTGRVRAAIEKEQLDDLAALGIDWDGPVVRQSERLARYREALTRLEASGLTYRCWCTRREIREAASAPHGPLPEGAYPGTCRALSSKRVRELERSHRPPAVRLRADAARVGFRDELAGAVEGAVDDFVLVRGDGAFAYNLAAAVDDGTGDVGEVVRGADLLETTPRQVHLMRVLELSEPAYAHVPLVLGPDGKRLAKRHGAAVALSAAQTLSWLAASLGLAEEGEAVTASSLLERFEPSALPREAVVYRDSFNE